MMNNSWKNRYVAPTPSLWTGRKDEPRNSRLFDQVQCVDLINEPSFEAENRSFGFLGFSCDEGVRRNQGNQGAASGPEALRKALASQPLHLKEPAVFYDFGDITCFDSDLEEAQSSLGKIVEQLHCHKIKPILLGGGHEISWGHYQGILSAHKDRSCGIVNFDAHFDLRSITKDGKGSSGTPFFQIATRLTKEQQKFSYLCIGIQEQSNTADLFQRAEELSVQYIKADDIHQNKSCKQAIDRILEATDTIYLTICLDVFGASFAPGVSAPQVGGLSPMQVSPLIKYLVSSGKVIGFDIAEMCPSFDQRGMTARLGASLIASYIHLE